MKKEVYTTALAVLLKLTAKLETTTPRWQHIITRNRYNSRLAKSQLLDSP